MFRQPRRWSPGSRRLVALFLVVLAPPAAALIGLGLRVLEQDQRLLAQRELEQREATADAAVRSLTESLESARSALDRGEPLPGSVLLRLSADGLVVEPADGLAWTPAPTRLDEADARHFAAADLACFRRLGDRGRATCESLARSPDPRLRAGALLRLARLFRTDGMIDASLRTYGDLVKITTVALDGMPADLLARRASCGLLQQSGRTEALARCVSDLERDLVERRWSLDHAAWQLSADEIARWAGRPLSIGADDRAASTAADWLWKESRRTEGRLPRAGRRTIPTDDGPVTVTWATPTSGLKAIVVGSTLADQWVRTASQAGRLPESHIALVTDSGLRIAGPMAPAGTHVTRRGAEESGLPWNVLVTPGSSGTAAADLITRRWILGAGLAAIMLLIGGGGILIWRVVERELAVARLHTDFVAAVSHEFRTPLTSLQHVTELLEEDDELPRDRRRSLYGVIGRSTSRLSGLVESLLDFARMEDGRKPYDLQPVDAGALAVRVVEDFMRQLDTDGVTVTTLVGAGDLAIRADQHALAHALWNLLENAVKYSARPCAVRVSVDCTPVGVIMTVRDDGPGIPSHEQREVFQKFVRGAEATRLGIKGTGLGLAMVSHIVDAHHGRIELESELGRGSQFRLVFPTAGATDDGFTTATLHLSARDHGQQ